MSKILIVLTSHGTLGDSGKSTGFYWEELTTPYWAFRDAGHEVVLASIAGGLPPHDPSSLEAEGENPETVARFRNDATAMEALRNTQPVSKHDPGDFDAVFLPGGHGTMWDLPESKALATLVGTMFDNNKVVSAVCHGPAGLVAARRSDGRPVVEGRRVNGFTDEEEKAMGLESTVPFLLEERLRGLGAKFESVGVQQPHAVRDGNLVTGQNPASAGPVAGSILAALREQQGEDAVPDPDPVATPPL